jgi:hypothetical protein
MCKINITKPLRPLRGSHFFRVFARSPDPQRPWSHRLQDSIAHKPPSDPHSDAPPPPLPIRELLCFFDTDAVISLLHPIIVSLLLLLV